MRALADALSWSRVASAPLVVVAVLHSRPAIALAWTAWAVVSDVLDGVVARRGRTGGSPGVLLDAGADMIFLTAAFGALTMVGAVPPLLLVLMVASFLPFASAAARGPRRGTGSAYDPLGKHLGTMLYLLLLLALGLQDGAIVAAGSVAAILLLGVSIVLRLARVTPRFVRR